MKAFNVIEHLKHQKHLIEINRLNKIIHQDSPRSSYHMKHIDLTWKYAEMILNKLSSDVDRMKLKISALAHDVLKENKFDTKLQVVVKDGMVIPQNLNIYLRQNSEVLEEYDIIPQYGVQDHAFAGGIFLKKELGISDKEILYPIFFHSGPIIPVYENLDPKIQTAVDIIMLADKLSSNWLRINELDKAVPFDLDLVVFGQSGHEFNYALGLFLARILSGGDPYHKSSIGLESLHHYHQRLCRVNPMVPDSCPVYRSKAFRKVVAKLSKKYFEEVKLWPKRPLRWNMP